jgi:serine/threonine protein kinase
MKRSTHYTTTYRLSKGIEKIVLDNGIQEFQVIYKKPNTNWNTLEGKLCKGRRNEKEKVCLELIKNFVKIPISSESSSAYTDENKTLITLDLTTKQHLVSVTFANKYEKFPNSYDFTFYNTLKIQEIRFLELICFNGFSEISKINISNETKILKKFVVGNYLNRELNFISKINSPNIVNIESTVCYNTKLIGYIMEPLQESKEIFKQKQYQQLDKKLIQILDGIIDIHDKNISHCDIKLENIMIDKEDRIKIIDFGSAEWLGSIAKPKTTEPFAPPEAKDKELVIKESYDVYSFGILLAQTLSENIYQELNEEILQDKKYGHIIRKCLNKDFNKRPSLKTIKTELEKM